MGVIYVQIHYQNTNLRIEVMQIDTTKIDSVSQDPLINSLLENEFVNWLAFIGIFLGLISAIIAIFPGTGQYAVKLIRRISSYILVRFGGSKQRIIQRYVLNFMNSDLGKKYLINHKNQNLKKKVLDSFAKLKKNKVMSEIEEDVYYVYLFSLLKKSKSRVWAASISDPLEWTDTNEEQLFLDLNIEASDRKIPVERIFIIKENSITDFLKIKPIQRQIIQSDESEYYFTYYAYHKDIPGALVRDIASGFLAFDELVVAKDVFSDKEIRGILETESLARHNKIFTKLRQYTHPLDKDFFYSKMGTEYQLLQE